MKKWLLFGILALGAAGGARAQESGKPVFAGEASGSSSANNNSAAAAIAPQHFFNDFLSGSAGNVSFTELAGQKFGDLKFAGANLAAPLTSAALPQAAPESQRIYRDTIYRWELGVGFTYVKFRSPAINTGMLGLNTSVTYFAKNWLGVEGNITAAFGGTIFMNEREKYAGFTGGPKIAVPKQGWEPWVHVLVGMGRVNPQLAGVSRNGFAVQMGGGADIALRGPFAARVEGDWVHTQLFKSSQNNFQMVAGIVLHLSF